MSWSLIEAEASVSGPFPLRAYSELMPPPYVGIKPYAPLRAHCACTSAAGDDGALDVSEAEQAQELEPGLRRIADHIVHELTRLLAGEAHALSRTLLDGNPAWPAELAAAAAAGKLAGDPVVILTPLALSRTQDDKGNVRWTLFGASHEGPSAPFWRGLAGEDAFDRLLAWAAAPGARVLADPGEAPPFLGSRLLGEGVLPRHLVTFRPFSRLPPQVRAAYLAGELTLLPTPASLIFFEHPRYRELAAALPRAMQIPLLHLFPRVDGSCTIRVPQSGWLDEDGAGGHGHRVVGSVVRSHRWQRQARDEEPQGYADKVSTALFSTDPDVIGLYDKPLAQNVQIWSEGYDLLLDGPRADRAALERAASALAAGGRFGYRFQYLPMRAGGRELTWHLPVVARRDPTGGGPALVLRDGAPAGYVTAEADGAAPLVLTPRLLDRPPHRQAATLFPRDPGVLRFTTSHNARKILDFRECLAEPLAPSLARALLRVARATSLDAWLDHLPAAAADAAAGAELAATLRGCLGAEGDPGAALTLAHTRTRAFAETLWRTIADLSEGELTAKDNADAITVNRGKTGGPAARAAHVVAAERRDLDRLGDHLHERYRALIARHHMEGRAEVVDHRFAWETDFEFPWMGGWARNQAGEPRERNIVLMIPGRDRGEAVIMGDHYDTAYMEDVYDADRGGDKLRAAAAGADDNHSATATLLCAADVLLPLARAGKLARDVWLVHLTGEEFPADCMGARALCRGLVERNLSFTAEDGSRREVGAVRAVAAFVLDMVAHNSHHADVFQIAPGEGAGAARLAERAHRANLRWNRDAQRHGPRARRMPDGKEAPPPFADLPVQGEIRVEWEPRSALYNTDGQIFSDVGIPVVLFMENYDISRTGYHDTLDTMANIDLDYAAALAAIAIETVAETAM